MLEHLIIQLLLYYLSNGRLREVTNNENFQLLAVKVAAVALRKVVAYKRFQT